MRQGEQHSLGLEAVGLVEAFADHPPVRVELAVLPGDELAEAGQVLPGPPEQVRVTGDPVQLDHLGQADQAEGMQVLVGRRGLVGAGGAETVDAEQGARREADVIGVAEGQHPVGGAAGQAQEQGIGPLAQQAYVRHHREVAVL